MDSPKKHNRMHGPVTAGPYIFMFRPSIKKIETTKPQETLGESALSDQSLHCVLA